MDEPVKTCPLIFEPIFKPKIWGGRLLSETVGKSLPGDEPIGESWELADLEEDQSVVRRGPAKGMTLSALVRDWGKELIGRASLFGGRFPLLIKFLDARQHLSVQVHPDQSMADRLGGNVRVKNEAWYILHADEDGAIYRGLAEGVDRASFVDAIGAGKVASTLRRIAVKAGQCYYLPSGTVHALGAGVVVAEIQTPSDITYRVYDWDRVDPKTGQGRALHIDEALECIHFGDDTDGAQPRSHVGSVWTAVTRLVTCDSFVIEQVRMIDGIEQDIPVGEMQVWVVLSGKGEVIYDGGSQRLTFGRGDTVLIPARLDAARLKTTDDCVWLEVTIPIASDLAGYPHPERIEQTDQPGERVVQINVPGKDSST